MSAAAGIVLRDAGAAAAEGAANRAHVGWTDQAYELLRQYAAGSLVFTPEDVRKFAAKRGLPPPPDSRAWGGVFMRARRAGIIRHGGYRASENPSRHGGPVSQWLGC